MKHRSNSQRDAMRESSKILVDAELSVVGQGIMPREKTTWDSRLDEMVPFEPGVLGLELQVGGLFLGELVRQIVMDAIKLVGLFDGHLPELTQAPMNWGLQHGAVLEVSAPADAGLPQLVAKSFGLPFKPSLEDICFVRQICQAVIKRAAAYVAVSTYSMRSLQVLSRDAGDDGVSMDACKVACLGSVIEKYPGFMSKSQEYLDQLQHVSSQKSGPKFGALHLQACAESSLTGVAVAAMLGKPPDSDMTNTTRLPPTPPDNLEVTKLPESYDVVGKTTGSVSVVESKSRDGVIIQGRPAKQSSFWTKIRSLFAVCRRCT
ncbi:N-acetylglucosamine kinase 1 [Fusarium oxysporum]|nr:N-acetylglucosamine kinase 1 [Fusarium oxysporum]KAJ4031408.1 N-acetylglucosamine kinase 1 [Fusarium oxysporum]KAJ4035483.1 N-acetylglucosamine kinase 1 [Fusarium oxysporum]KAJ4072746.1 N-acetylglucosamine kinase 1 [Fusarium oxysporum]KAJ4072910.1 N-acetylglucosamine kinase 1 [Fusarium oxysporum]